MTRLQQEVVRRFLRAAYRRNWIGEAGVHGLVHAYTTFVLADQLCGRLRRSRSLSKKFPLSEGDRLAILVAAALHDCGRRSDGFEPDHGLRGAELFLDLAPRMTLPTGVVLSESVVAEAIKKHCWFEVDADPVVVQVVRDADKLDRVRLGKDFLDKSRLQLPVSPKLIEFSEAMDRDLEAVKEFLEV